MRKHEYGDRDSLNRISFATISSKTCYTDTRVVVYFIHAGSTVATSEKQEKLNTIEIDRQEMCPNTLIKYLFLKFTWQQFGMTYLGLNNWTFPWQPYFDGHVF